MTQALDGADWQQTVWDAIVVGTGMGGSTTGYELARQGFRVLFLEKGPFIHQHLEAAPPGLGNSILGPGRPPSQTSQPVEHDSGQLDQARFQQGWWPHRVTVRSDRGVNTFPLPIGCGSGGSTAFYAASLERFAPEDFSPRANFPLVDDAALPDQWPIDYDELVPYYERAEALYRVRGTQDPLYRGPESKLLPPSRLNQRDEHFVEIFRNAGLHPYRVHAGYQVVEGCTGCQDGHCPKACKSDAAWTCLIPALMNHDARIVPECEVIRLEAGQSAVNEVVCDCHGNRLRLRARVIVLAAGAFSTPAILLRSGSSEWPSGLANGSDLVGRNLMFHAGDFVAIRPDQSLDGSGTQKTLAINDFYHRDGAKLGTFQTLGVRLEVGGIMQYLRDTAESNPTWWSWLFSPRPVWWRKLTSPFIRLGALFAYRALRFKDASVWASIIEDLPYHRNRVVLAPNDDRSIEIQYTYSSELKQRVLMFRERLKSVLGSKRLMVLSPENKIDYPHACGTCRFGNDPATSVLDRDNRAHGIENLFVVDASFFPSSAGTNPSLTIAANALRVAEVISEQLRR